MATDATKAVFGARARELTGVLDDDNYRVVVNILWYRTDGSVAGRVTRRVDFNHRQDDEDADVDFGAFHSTCVGHFGF